MNNLFKILLTFFAFCLFTFAFIMPLNPVDNWYQQFLPNLNGRSISDIFFLDSLTGWAVTPFRFQNDTTFVMKTTNSGDNWFIQFAGYGQFVGRNKIIFLNNNTGFTCGNDHFTGSTKITKTTDSGNSWFSISDPTTATYEDMAVLNENTIWLVSSSSLTGGVFFTSTGGANWVQQYSAGSQNPEKIYMFNERIGFISDNSGSSSIRKTTNGGLNWNLNVSGQWYFDITFADSLTGWYSAASNIYKTTNGGNNWVLQNVPSGPDLLNLGINELALLNKDTLWAAGNAVFYPNSQVRAILLRTTNGGVNWQYQVPDTAINNFLYYFIQFSDKNHGWAYTTLRGIHTTTGGDPIWITALEQTSTEVPKGFKLFQNYPNPFNPNTKIKFQLLKHSNAEITIYDITGRRIQKLLNDELIAGEYEIDFNAAGLSSGTYFYKLTVTTGKEVFTQTKKMLMIK